MQHFTIGLVTEIHGAGVAVIDFRRSAIDASQFGVTGGHAVAERSVFACQGLGARIARPFQTGVPDGAGISVIADQGVGYEETGALLAGVVRAGVVVIADQGLATTASLGALVLSSARVIIGTPCDVGDVLASGYGVAGVIGAEIAIVATVFVCLTVTVVIDAVAALLGRVECIAFTRQVVGRVVRVRRAEV